jgi:hypothetical protein
MGRVRDIVMIVAAILLIMTTIAYILLEVWIIPTYVEKAEQEMAARYSGYAYTAVTTMLTAETIIHVLVLTTGSGTQV